MGKLIGLVKPLFPIMMAAILLGTLGYLCAIFLTIFAGQGILSGLKELFDIVAAKNGNGVWIAHLTGVKVLFVCMIVMAVLRGVLHYIEQYCNHFIAFKLLAIIRHKVFASLRRLCPAKLEGRDKGNLISIITTDIELLEVFYAHLIHFHACFPDDNGLSHPDREGNPTRNCSFHQMHCGTPFRSYCRVFRSISESDSLPQDKLLPPERLPIPDTAR